MSDYIAHHPLVQIQGPVLDIFQGNGLGGLEADFLWLFVFVAELLPFIKIRNPPSEIRNHGPAVIRF